MINGAHPHLILNHFPVIGILFCILLFLYGLARRSEEIKKAGRGVFVVLAFITVPVYLPARRPRKQ